MARRKRTIGRPPRFKRTTSAAIGGGGARRAPGIVRLWLCRSDCESGGGGAGLQWASRGRDHGECGVARGVDARKPRTALPPMAPGVGGVALPSGSARCSGLRLGGPRPTREAEAGGRVLRCTEEVRLQPCEFRVFALGLT